MLAQFSWSLGVWWFTPGQTEVALHFLFLYEYYMVYFSTVDNWNISKKFKTVNTHPPPKWGEPHSFNPSSKRPFGMRKPFLIDLSWNYAFLGVWENEANNYLIVNFQNMIFKSTACPDVLGNRTLRYCGNPYKLVTERLVSSTRSRVLCACTLVLLHLSMSLGHFGMTKA